jgi:hypothetical protein
MVTALIGVVGALAGTIVGSLLTQVLQRRNAAHARLHEARLEAYRGFATAVMDFRKALMDRWFIENEGRPHLDGHDVYATRSAVWAAYYQVLLVAGDDDIVQRAQQARDLTSSLKNVTTRADLNDRGDACRIAVGQFADAARQEVSLVRTRGSRQAVTPADS